MCALIQAYNISQVSTTFVFGVNIIYVYITIKAALVELVRMVTFN